MSYVGKNRKSIVSVSEVTCLLSAPHSKWRLYSSSWRLDVSKVLIWTAISILVRIFFNFTISSTLSGQRTNLIVISISPPFYCPIISFISKLLCTQHRCAIILLIHIFSSCFSKISLIIFLEVSIWW